MVGSKLVWCLLAIFSSLVVRVARGIFGRSGFDFERTMFQRSAEKALFQGGRSEGLACDDTCLR